MKGVSGRPNLAGSVPVSLAENSAYGVLAIDDVRREVNRTDAEDYQGLMTRAARCRDGNEAVAILQEVWDLFHRVATRLVEAKDPNYYVPQSQKRVVDDWAKSHKPNLRIAPRERYEVEDPASLNTGMTWDELRGNTTFKPTEYTDRDLGDLWDVLRDNMERDFLAKLVNAAKGLDLTEGYTGMAFHIAEANVQGTDVNVSTVSNKRDTQNKSAADCYESRNLPVAMSQNWNGHILVHQSKTPCVHCCNGYKNWAMESSCTIVVAVSDDRSYDQFPANPTFIFSRTGRAAYLG